MSTDGGFLRLLRAVALLAVVAGAAGSIGLMLRAGQRTPRFIYGGLVDLKPPGSANAFLFVLVPPVSWLFMPMVVPVAALISRRKGRSME